MTRRQPGVPASARLFAHRRPRTTPDRPVYAASPRGVVNLHDGRFPIGLTDDQRADLAVFLLGL